MYVNAKMIPLETVPGMGRAGWGRVVEGLISSMICR
jgi:hypothetical protein